MGLGLGHGIETRAWDGGTVLGNGERGVSRGEDQGSEYNMV